MMLGFDDDFFVSRYVPTSSNYSSDLPNFESSLEVFAGLFENNERLCRALENKRQGVKSLFQGYTSPVNAVALRSFLNKHQVSLDETLAVDLLDIPSIYNRLGLALSDMRFIRADACALKGIVDKNSVDFVIQDFTINCLPDMRVPLLFREARRVIRDSGLLFISFTDTTGLMPTNSAIDAFKQSDVEFDHKMTSLAEAANSSEHYNELRSRLVNSVLELDAPEHFIVVTPPYGKFEFFQPATNTFDMLGEAGFNLFDLSKSVGKDAAELTCTRYRCLLGSDDSTSIN